MKIVLVASEVAPFAQTGGLAQVTGSLPRALSALGHQVAVMMPMYRCAAECGRPIRDTGARVQVPVAGNTVHGEVWEGFLPGDKVPVCLIRQPEYFDRDGLYGTPEGGYGDNCERFAFFCRATLEAVRALGWRPDVLHLNDWQAALVPVYQKVLYAGDEFVGDAATVFTQSRSQAAAAK